MNRVEKGASACSVEREAASKRSEGSEREGRATMVSDRGTGTATPNGGSRWSSGPDRAN